MLDNRLIVLKGSVSNIEGIYSALYGIYHIYIYTLAIDSFEVWLNHDNNNTRCMTSPLYDWKSTLCRQYSYHFCQCV